MLQLLLLMFFGWLVTNYKRPVLFASLAAGLFFVLGLVFETGLAAASISAVSVLIFSVPYFWLIDRYSDSIFIWLCVLAGFPCLWLAAWSHV